MRESPRSAPRVYFYDAAAAAAARGNLFPLVLFRFGASVCFSHYVYIYARGKSIPLRLLFRLSKRILKTGIRVE